ncbi:hypothetical protein R6Q59_009813 [Mikania micrantha]
MHITTSRSLTTSIQAGSKYDRLTKFNTYRYAIQHALTPIQTPAQPVHRHFPLSQTRGVGGTEIGCKPELAEPWNAITDLLLIVGSRASVSDTGLDESAAGGCSCSSMSINP